MWLGQQLILEAHDCGVELVPERVHAVLRELPPRVGLTIVSGPTLTDESVVQGARVFTGLVILAESHLALHTFPDRRAVHVDLFSCKTFDAETVRAFLRVRFEPARLEDRLFERCA